MFDIYNNQQKFYRQNFKEKEANICTVPETENLQNSLAQSLYFYKLMASFSFLTSTSLVTTLTSFVTG